MSSMRAPGKIVIVSQHYAPDPSTTATYLTAIAERLKLDFEVLVISGTARSASQGEPRVVEMVSWTPEKAALVRRTVAIGWFSVKMFFATLKHVAKHDVVLCVTTPFMLPYSVTLATRLRGAAAVLLIYDLYPEAMIMAGLVLPRSLTARIIRFANGFLFGALDTIITIGRDVEALLLTYRRVDSRQIRFIPNWALLPIRYRVIDPDNSFRQPFGDRLVVGLSGNLGFTHHAVSVYEAARLLEGEKDIHFLLSGWGSGWKQLQEMHERDRLPNVTMTAPVAESELEEFLSAADVWIIPYRRSVAGVSVPSRIYNLLAVGRPVIVAGETHSEAAMMLIEENIGWVVRPEDSRDLAGGHSIGRRRSRGDEGNRVAAPRMRHNNTPASARSSHIDRSSATSCNALDPLRRMD